METKVLLDTNGNQKFFIDLEELIAKIAEGSKDNRLIRKRMAGLRRVGHLGKKVARTKLQALVKEIFND